MKILERRIDGEGYSCCGPVAAASGLGAAMAQVRARRARLEADLIDEGASDAMVARLATDETAGRIVAHEHRILDSITAMFGEVRG